jgi:hypothetical protein
MISNSYSNNEQQYGVTLKVPVTELTPTCLVVAAISQRCVSEGRSQSTGDKRTVFARHTTLRRQSSCVVTLFISGSPTGLSSSFKRVHCPKGVPIYPPLT